MPALQQESDESFAQRIMPELQRIEKMRAEKAALYGKRKTAAVVMGIALFSVALCLYILLGHKIGTLPCFFIVFAGTGALWFWADIPRQEYIKEYKSNVMTRVAKLLGLSRYDERGGRNIAACFPAAKITPPYDNCYTEDLFEGNYKGAFLAFCEMRLEKVERRDKEVRHITVFKGLALSIKLPHKKFFGQTILLRGQGGIVEWFMEKALDLKRADLVDPVFEKMFTVYTSDQTEARYLIDPAMMERVMQITGVFGAEEVSMSYFGDSQILAMIGCDRNSFEAPGIDTPATHIDAVMRIKHELAGILNFIDYLELYRPVEYPGTINNGAST